MTYRIYIRFLIAIFYLLTCVLGIQAQQLPPNFNDSKLIDDIGEPISLNFSNDGKQLFVSQKVGKIWVYNWDGSNYVKQVEPVIDLSEEVCNMIDLGLMSFCLDPNFSQNQTIYLFYSVDFHHLFKFGTPEYDRNASQPEHASISRVTKYVLQRSDGKLTADLNSRKILLGEDHKTGIPSTANVHMGGTLLFGTDGSLLVSTGDNAGFMEADKGSKNDTYFQEALDLSIMRPAENVGAYRAQMLGSLCGKILRLDPNTGNGLSSNPFFDAGNPRSSASRIWALGFRNPFRMTLKPETGSADPAAANPGTLLVSDVGYIDWEDLHLIDKPGMNAGWPVYEGLETTSHGFFDPDVKNTDEPNALSFVSLCGQPNVQVPQNANERRTVHAWPILTWRHNVDDTKVWKYENGQPKVVDLGAPSSDSNGTPFNGTCISAGVFYTGNSFPSQYRNYFLLSEFDKNWVKTVHIHDASTGHNIHHVANFGDNLGSIVDMKVNPLDGSVVYADVRTAQLRRIAFGGNQPPVAKITADKTFGTSPLTVHFDAGNSSDPEGQQLSFFWEFGDGTTSTNINAQKVFSGTQGQGFTVKLTVTDTQGASDQTTLNIGLQVDPPTTRITSPSPNALYKMGIMNSYQATAVVTDANISTLTYEWKIYLRHNTHEHLEQTLTDKNPTLNLMGVGCDGDDYRYYIELKVTNGAGLMATDSVKVYPDCPPVADCGNSGQLFVETWKNLDGLKVSDIPNNRIPNTAKVVTMSGFESLSQIGDFFGVKYRGYLCVPQSGYYTFYIACDDDGELYLSTDNNAANKRRIAYMGETGWVPKYQWNQGATQKSSVIRLIGGQKYYIEAIYKERLGDDHMAIGWTTPTQHNITVIPSSVLSPAPPNACSPTIKFNNCPTSAIQIETTSNTIAYLDWEPKIEVKRCYNAFEPINLQGRPAGLPFEEGSTTLVYTATCQEATARCTFDVIVVKK